MDFKKNLQIEFDNIVREKNGLEYVPWATAWAKFKEYVPNGRYEFVMNCFQDDPYYGTFLFGNTEMGFIVKTMVWDDDEPEVKYDWDLPVIDFRNKPIKEPNVMDINKSRMRCLVKNIAVASGVGLPIFAGEAFQDAEVNVEVKKVRDEIKVISKEIVALDKTKANTVKTIIGNGGNPSKIETAEQAKEIKVKLEAELKKTKTKKTTPKKEEVK